MVGYVYLMTNGKEYKIGLTGSEPEKRMKQLQTGNSSKIELVGYVVCKDMEKLESNLHREFSFKRQTGEWFALDDNDLHAIFERFKTESINDDMSLVPKIVTDIEKFMQIDGQRLANGKNLLHKNKYLHIENHKKIVMKYMQEKKVLIDNKKLKKKKREESEYERYEKQEKLMQKDARRIVKGEEPLYTFDYADFNDWENYLESVIDGIKYDLVDLMKRDAVNIAKGLKTKYVRYKQMVNWEKLMEPMIKREKRQIETEKKANAKFREKEAERRAIERKAEREKEAERRAIERKAEREKEAERKKRVYDCKIEYEAKQLQRKAEGKVTMSWQNFVEQANKLVPSNSQEKTKLKGNERHISLEQTLNLSEFKELSKNAKREYIMNQVEAGLISKSEVYRIYQNGKILRNNDGDPVFKNIIMSIF